MFRKLTTTKRLRAAIYRRIAGFGLGRMEIHSAVLEALVNDAEEHATWKEQVERREVLRVSASLFDHLEDKLRAAEGQLSAINEDFRKIGGASNSMEAWQNYHAMEGRALAAEEQRDQLITAICGYPDHPMMKITTEEALQSADQWRRDHAADMDRATTLHRLLIESEKAMQCAINEAVADGLDDWFSKVKETLSKVVSYLEGRT